ncbi:hypothetical protein EPO15_08095 [bacterium]|nr:MAG: hypothetical protein EPO15_08095 [bacterium]
MSRQVLLDASVVAARGLRTNLRDVPGPDGRVRRLVAAGPGQYGSVWTRDFAWSVEGLLLAGEDRAVRDTLDALLAAQRPDGLVPRLLDTRWPWARFARAVLKERLALHAPLVPNFRSDQFVYAYDANALLVWAACEYALRRDELAWAGLVLPRLEAALSWYETHESQGLVVQPPCSDWKDKLKARRGAVFYTNLARWKAASALAALYAGLGRRAAAQEAESAAKTLQRRLERAFWDAEGGCYRDTAQGSVYSSDSNLAACVWGFADPERAAKSLRALDRCRLWTPWGPRAGQTYPASEKSWLSRLAGIPGYHDEGVWLWISALALDALALTGREAHRARLAAAVAGLLTADGAAGEVYHPETGRPLSGRLYRAESPFTWSSAMLLAALTRAAAGTPAALETA